MLEPPQANIALAADCCSRAMVRPAPGMKAPILTPIGIKFPVLLEVSLATPHL